MSAHSASKPASTEGRFRSVMIAWACVGVIGLPWLFPTRLLSFATPLQPFLAAAGLLLLVSAIWISPASLKRRPLSLTEWVLIAFIVVGSLPTLAGPAPVGRLVSAIWWVQAALFMVLVARLAHREQMIRVLKSYSALAVFVSVIFMLYRLAGLGIAPFIIHQNHLALLLILPIFYYLSRLLVREGKPSHIGDVLRLALVIGALLVTQSRAVWLGVALSTVLLVAIFAIRTPGSRGRYQHRVRVVMLPLCLGAAVIFVDFLATRLGSDSLFSVLETLAYFDEGSIGGRLRRWANTIPLIQDHLITGVGLGNWLPAFAGYRHAVLADPGGNASAVNTYLLVLAETGLVGFGLFSLFLFGILRRGFSSPLQIGVFAAAIAWLVALCFHSLYDFKIVLLGFSLVCGLLLWGVKEQDAAPYAVLGRPLASVILVLAVSMFALDARYALADLERIAVKRVIHKPALRNRFIWRLIDPISEIVSVPLTRDSLRKKTAQIDRTSEFLLPDERDLPLVMARFYIDLGDEETARSWFEKALARNPESVSALAALCELATTSGEYAAARELCTRGLSVNSAVPHLHRLLAALDKENGDSTGAVAHLEAARNLLRKRLDLNDFGRKTLKLVSRYYDDYREINNELSAYRAHTGLSREAVLTEILNTPALHKSLAVVSCELFFSTNINARYNLWKRNLCTGSPGIQILTNDSLSPFRLRGSEGRVYFISDQRGNSHYRLYHLDTESRVVNKAHLPEGRVTTYALSPQGEYLAVVQFADRAFRLYIGNTGTNDLEQVFKSRHPLERLVWHPSAKELLFVKGHRTVHRLQSAEEIAELFDARGLEIGELAYSPSGREIAYTLRSGPTRSSLAIRQIDSQEVRIVVETDDSVLADPLWLDEKTLVLRENRDDEFLLRRISLDNGTLTSIGPQSGVVYGVQYEPESDSLVFVAATGTIPAAVYRLFANQSQAEPVLRLDWITPESVAPLQREVIDASRDIVAYRYRQTGVERHRAAVIWLHGGSNRFSPRWHLYAQYLAHSGYDFIALNYSEEWSPRDARSPRSFSTQAEETESLIRKLRDDGYKAVYLLGVSTGTHIIQEVLRRNAETVDGAVEYSPVDDAHWSAPQKLAPMLVFSGENDVLLDHQQRADDIERHRALGSEIDWVVYEGEGHDLRGRKSVEARLLGTIKFLDRLTDQITVAKWLPGDVEIEPAADRAKGLKSLGFASRDLVARLSSSAKGEPARLAEHPLSP